MGGEADDPEGSEGEKAGDYVNHASGVGAMVRMKIGLHGVVEREKDDQENPATKPGEPGAEICEGGGRLLWSQPIFFVGKINFVRGQARDDAREPEDGNRSERDGSHKESEEYGFSLPAGGVAAPVEMGSDDFGQSRVDGPKVNRGENRKRDENTSGQSRILHGVLYNELTSLA